jgi:hypothetical protein
MHHCFRHHVSLDVSYNTFAELVIVLCSVHVIFFSVVSTVCRTGTVLRRLSAQDLTLPSPRTSHLAVGPSASPKVHQVDISLGALAALYSVISMFSGP